MLQSEFVDRTKVSLTGEQYKEVEHIYNSVEMDKDEFCTLWLKNRDNKIIVELMNTVKKLEDDCRQMRNECESLTEEMESLKAMHSAEMDNEQLMHRNHMEDFAKKLIKAGEYDFPTDIYDVVEEEFGLPFIIHSKWEQSIDLTEEEIEYMVKKL